jgi:hypothetical protein
MFDDITIYEKQLKALYSKSMRKWRVRFATSKREYKVIYGHTEQEALDKAQRFVDSLNPVQSFCNSYDELPPTYKNLYLKSIANAKVREIEHRLTPQEFCFIYNRAKGRCEVTGTPLSYSKIEKAGTRHPFAPSLDRIDASRIYTLDNCRLVCLLINAALGDWGERSLYRVFDHFYRMRREQATKTKF